MTESEKALAIEHLGRMVKEGRYLDCGSHISLPVLHSLGIALNALKERKTGKWIESTGYDCRDHFYSCSECGRHINLICGAKLSDYPYCHCGARMEVDE